MKTIKVHLSLALLLVGTLAANSHAQTLYVPGGSVGNSSNSNVGIGTSSPDEKLTVNGAVHVLSGGYVVVDKPGSTPSGSVVQLSSPAATPGLILMMGDGSGNVLRRWDVRASGTHFVIADSTAGQNRLAITSAGNVGIGTTSPGQLLHVAGGLQIDGAIVAPEGTLRDDNGGWVRTYGATGWYSQTYGGGWYMSDSTWIRSYNSKSIYHNAGVLRTDGTFQVGSSGSTLSVATNGSFAYRTDVLFANTTGNVGIGTATPTHKLSVNGTIRTKEVIVEPSPWPDYVFSPEYELPTLEEVKAHIAEKGHLPDVPSADEVAARGVPVGEMQATLLRKIEELTLYLIESRQENADLRRRIETLEEAAK